MLKVDDAATARLAELGALDILDTAPEPQFDDVAELAAQICETPVALVSFVDDHRQWFKSRIGLTICETGLDMSVCAHAIRTPGLTVIQDMRDDPRTARNPLTYDGVAMRFYAGAPLVLAEGVSVGTLCVLDIRPRNLEPRQRRALETLAAQLSGQLELRRALIRQRAAAAEAEARSAELAEAVARQDILAREIDHRVKNSLQQVRSLLSLQSRRAGEGALREALERAADRVGAVALLHAEMHRASMLDRVALAPFCARLADHLRPGLPAGVTLDAEAPDLWLSSGAASAIAILINEFVANAAKHAFPDGRTGRIDIAARTCGHDLVLTLSDDGVGMTGEAGDGLGLKIMEASVVSLDGKMTVPPGVAGFGVTARLPGLVA